ncbi:MAG: hypothetical protein RMJ44_09410 [Cytophagales bacterium]|nr:hypothetical protein [Bernardetiaceae bacterium]MDW8211292.1 hypothetical protein [Cytophagales bacterium]
MLSIAQLNALADKINAAINLPFVDESTEKQLITGVLQQLNGILTTLLTTEQLSAIGDANKGIEMNEAAKNSLQSDLMKKLSSHLNTSLLSGALGSNLSKIIAETLVNAMQKGNKL